jgi:hypothetical protein
MNISDSTFAICFIVLFAFLYNIASWLMKIHRELVEIKNYSKADFEDRRNEMIKRL